MSVPAGAGAARAQLFPTTRYGEHKQDANGERYEAVADTRRERECY